MQTNYLKNIKNGRIFIFNPLLAKRKDMVPCDKDGNMTNSIISATETENSREVTKFLGKPETGMLYAYSPVLAKRDDMVSINSEAEWESYMAGREEVKEAKKAQAVVLERGEVVDAIVENGYMMDREDITTGSEETPGDTDETHTEEAEETTGLTVPDVMNEPRLQAKKTIANWAKDHFGVEIKRNQPLEGMISVCNQLIADRAA